MKLLRIVVPLLLLAGLFYFFGFLPRQRNQHEIEAAALAEKNRVPIVNAVSLKQADDSSGLVLPGQIQPYHQTDLYARTQGFLRRWYVDIGARVSQGQLLATIDAPELDQDIARARADRQLAQTNLDRLKSVQLPGAVATQDIDNRRSALAVAQANLARLEALKNLQQIRAPFGGVITSRNAENGMLVAPGGNTPLFTISELGSLRVFVDVPQTYFQAIRIGMPATVKIPELKQAITGKVVRTSGTLRSDSRTLLTEVVIPNLSRALPSGLYCQVSFDLGVAKGPVMLPANALQITPAGPRVVVVDSQNKVRFVSVALGRDYGNRIEVTSGLTGSERVVMNPNDRLREGQLVQLRTAVPTSSAIRS